MKRNAFGDPQPASAEEIEQAMDERDLQPEFAQAQIFPPSETEAPPFQGWVAEISDADTGENRISTLGFATLAELSAVLEVAGITLIEEA